MNKDFYISVNETNNASSRLYRIILRIIWISFIFLYIITPLHVKYSFYSYCLIFVFYLAGFFCFFKIKKKKNYFDFDTLFLSFCTIEHLFGGFYVNTDEFSRLFTQGIDNSVVIKASILSSVALLSYMEGGLIIQKKKQIICRIKNVANINIRFVFILFGISAIVYYVAGGFDFYRSQYMNGVGSMSASRLVFLTESLFVEFARIICAIVFLKILNGLKITFTQKVYICFVLLFAVLVAIVGNRTVFSFIVLPFAICFFSFIYPLNLKKTILLLLMGSFLMFVLQKTRQGYNNFEVESVLFLFSDVVAPSRTLYASLDYVDKLGVNYGLTMLPPIIGIVPSLSSILGDWTTIGSAEVMTKFLSDGSSNVGLGTTIVVDLYICFGFIGVILFMYYLGYFVNKRWNSSITYMIVQTSLFSSCIFMGRSSYLLPLRGIIWGLILIYILRSIANKNIDN